MSELEPCDETTTLWNDFLGTDYLATCVYPKGHQGQHGVPVQWHHWPPPARLATQLATSEANDD